MNRIRWFRLGTKGDLSALAFQMSSKVFSLDEPISSGFRIEKEGRTELTGQFIYKRTVDQKVTLPSGEEFIQEIANIEITKFGIDFGSSDALLYTFDAPRSLTSFFSALSEVTKFSCTVEPIDVDVDRWIQHISASQSTVSVTYVDVAGIVLSGEIQARLAMSGSNDVYSAMQKFLGSNHKGTIDSARIRIQFAGSYFVLELGRRATLKVPAGFPHQCIDLIRHAMLLAKPREG